MVLVVLSTPPVSNLCVNPEYFCKYSLITNNYDIFDRSLKPNHKIMSYFWIFHEH